MQPIVTILIAVYNSEQYLSQCLDSLIAQSMTQWQAICIDDASIDGSLQLLQQYQQKDSRIEVVSLTENHGQAYARNQGLKKACGEYICFLDSDDWFAPDALQQAVSTFDKYPLADSVLFDCRYVYPDRIEAYPMPQFNIMSGSEAFEKSLTWQIHGVYIVRASIHHKYPYDETARTYSDDNTTRLHYLASREVRTCKGVYYYRQHGESVTHKPGPQRFDYILANQSMKQILIDINAKKHILDIYENARWINIIGLLSFIYQNKKILSAADISYGLNILHTAWLSIETDRLYPRNKWKLGYMPMKWSWKLFLLQTNLYFMLRSVKEAILVSK